MVPDRLIISTSKEEGVGVSEPLYLSYHSMFTPSWWDKEEPDYMLNKHKHCVAQIHHRGLLQPLVYLHTVDACLHARWKKNIRLLHEYTLLLDKGGGSIHCFNNGFNSWIGRAWDFQTVNYISCSLQSTW